MMNTYFFMVFDLIGQEVKVNMFSGSAEGALPSLNRIIPDVSALPHTFFGEQEDRNKGLISLNLTYLFFNVSMGLFLNKHMEMYV